MADLPILFSAPMVRALLAGTKTQTRRLIDFNGVEKVLDFVKVAADTKGRAVYEMKDASGQFVTRPAGKGLVDYHFSPRIAVGDRLYVREQWRVSQKWDDTAPRDLPARTMTIFFEAGGSIANQASGKWEPDFGYPPSRPDWVGRFRQGMHMPKWASRLTLIVENVKVERLQDISEADAIAEGIEPTDLGTEEVWRNYYPEENLGRGFLFAANSYRTLWQSINGPRTWDDNPWVAAYTFSVVKQNIDLIEDAA